MPPNLQLELMRPIVLTIAGTDPLNGAGVTLDAAVVRQLGLHSAFVPAALVAQNSQGVLSWSPVDKDTVLSILDALADDVAVSTVKIGMTGGPDRLSWIVRAARERWPSAPVVLDPVMASGGPVAGQLSSKSTEICWLEASAGVDLVTPNAPELARFLGEPAAAELGELTAQARRVYERSGVAVLATGGHIEPLGVDTLVSDDGVQHFAALEWGESDLHGTGCALSSLIAGYLALKEPLFRSIDLARAQLASWSRDPSRVQTLGRGRPQLVFTP